MKLDRFAPMAAGFIVVAMILVALGILTHEVTTQLHQFFDSLPKG